MNSQNVTITMLLVTAAILTAALIGTFAGTSQQASAEASARMGDFSMTTGQMYGTSTYLLYVLDRDAQSLNAYKFNSKTKTTDLLDQVDLPKAFRGNGK